ncbi:AMP-binding protein [Streptomyces olivaceus]|uniref:AMP-binding protein n=1 Tax=Streptomyces olivaceus TaxID=47716 RepID=UPI003640633D
MTPDTLYSWFDRSVRAYPDAPALEVAGEVYSYARLCRRAESLAARLVEVGVPAVVGLLAARTADAYAGYLAALRLGAMVVPLNPAHPISRHLQVCAAAGVEVVLTEGHDLPNSLDMSTVTTEAATDVRQPPADRPAYLLFTSGSTGAPKGVGIRHHAVSAFLRHVIGAIELGPGCRMPSTADLTFDISVLEMFATWGAGATLVPPRSPMELLNPVRYASELRLTHWCSVPSAVSVADRLRMLTPGVLPLLRHSVFLGEQLTVAQARAWSVAAPASRISNLYGPTETTVACTGYLLPKDPAEWPGTSNHSVPIGSVFPGARVLVVDVANCLATEGELLVSGPQVFDGYLDSSRDEGRFVVIDGQRWYRTGDRVRFEDGLLVHLDRLDNQVKIRGYRVEPGEVETVLRVHPGAGEVVVLPATADSGEVELVVMFTGDVAELHLAALAADRLPVYMHPRHYLPVHEFPRNRNGKIDRRHLADIAADSVRSDS